MGASHNILTSEAQSGPLNRGQGQSASANAAKRSLSRRQCCRAPAARGVPAEVGSTRGSICDLTRADLRHSSAELHRVAEKGDPGPAERCAARAEAGFPPRACVTPTGFGYAYGAIPRLRPLMAANNSVRNFFADRAISYSTWTNMPGDVATQWHAAVCAPRPAMLLPRSDTSIELPTALASAMSGGSRLCTNRCAAAAEKSPAGARTTCHHKDLPAAPMELSSAALKRFDYPGRPECDRDTQPREDTNGSSN
jgi:hypothetical protein